MPRLIELAPIPLQYKYSTVLLTWMSVRNVNLGQRFYRPAIMTCKESEFSFYTDAVVGPMYR